ncbi:MAG: PQQ-binding-like beta-propeller repeat protein [bacterium]
MRTRGLIALMVVIPAGAVLAGGDDHSPAFRGPNGSGCYQGVAATSWSEAGKTGVLWKAKLDLPGWSSPVVWGDKVVVTAANPDKRQVYCFSAATGKLAWKTDIPPPGGPPRNYVIDSMSSHWDTLLHAGATPVTNGKQVFALFSNGQLVALELATGKQLWSLVAGDPSGNKYGLDNSLLVHGTSVIAVFQSDPERFIASYDGATGKQEWKTPRESSSWASPLLARTASGKMLVVLPADPDVTAWDAQTGTRVWSTRILNERPSYCMGPSPVTDGERVFVNCENNGIFALDLEKGSVVWDLKSLPDGSPFSAFCSMTTDGRRLYQFEQSILTVVEAKTGKVLAQKNIDQNSCEASPLVIGDKLYLVGSAAILVFKTGDSPEKTGEGIVTETIEATPAFAGGRLFIRTAGALYGIGP